MKEAPRSIRSLSSLFWIALLTSLTMTASGGSWIELVSVSSTGVQADDASERVSISADGRYVAFRSNAPNLVPGNLYFYPEVYLHDTVAGTTIRINVDTTGGELAAGDSNYPHVSGNGRYVAFWSNSTNLVTGDTNGAYDAFVRDTVSNTTTRVSVDSAGVEGNNGGAAADISYDGRFVLLGSNSTNLVPGGTTPGRSHAYVHDRDTGITSLVCVGTAGSEANDSCGGHAITSDGRYVVLGSAATNLVSGGTTGTYSQLFVHDRNTGTTSLVSVDSAGNEANYGCFGADISDDGRYVVFHSHATNLVPNDINGKQDVFLRDTVSNTTTLISADSSGNGGNLYSENPSISADGRYIAFFSHANNLVPDDGNGARDIFVHDRSNGVNIRASLDEAGGEANNESSSDLQISADGRYVAFRSFANNLVNEDFTTHPDIFIKAIPQVSVTSVTPNSLPRGATTSVTISGSYFLTGANPDVASAPVSNVVIVDENTITADVAVPSNAPTGMQDVSVILPGTGPGPLSGSSGTCVDCVTVPVGC